MDTFQRAEQDIIAAMFLNYHRPGFSRLLSRKELWEEFGIEVDDKIRFAVLAHLKKIGWIYSVGIGRAHLLESGYKPARQAVLDRIRGTSIEVDWEAGEVATDGALLDDFFPLPKDWKWTRMAPPAVPSHADIEDLMGRDVLLHHGVPLPEPMRKKSSQIDWGMWGTIVGVIGVIVAIVALF